MEEALHQTTSVLTHLQISVDHEAIVHVLQPQDDLGGVEAHLLLGKHSMLREVIVQVAPCKRRRAVHTSIVQKLCCCPQWPEGRGRCGRRRFCSSPTPAFGFRRRTSYTPRRKCRLLPGCPFPATSCVFPNTHTRAGSHTGGFGMSVRPRHGFG